ncbi:probable G-protein coupled receptor 101 [Mercenaria mercenaria]|uniref:probable G-protein coupled receptor 101 n=1 Tax=Mercenaria mercenaria TaxID=6596 RepID=UPI00234E9CD3|nr:probable G-protein coupled receptor 101 [Mercenaria mercenaria]
MEKELLVGALNQTSELRTLENMNSAEAERLIPTIVFMVIISVLGSIGNCLVIHVYRTRFKMSNSKCFILCLSAVDLLTCCISIPLDVSTTLDQYIFKHQGLCKVSRVFNVLGTISSSFILLFIAVERYRKVCKPFGWQIQIKKTKILCGLAIFLGVMVSWPAAFVFGIHTFDVPNYNLTGSECSTADLMKNTKFPFIYTFVFGFLFLGGITEMSILYCLIGLKVRKHARKMNVLVQKMSVLKPSSSNVTSDTKLDEVKTQYMSQKCEFTIGKDQNIHNERNSNLNNGRENAESLTDQQDTEKSCKSNMKSQELIKSRERLNTSKDLKCCFSKKESDVKSDPEVMFSRETNQIEINENRRSLKTKIDISVQERENDECNTEVNLSQEILQDTVLRRLLSSVSNRLKLKSLNSNSEIKVMVRKTDFSKQARARKTAFLMFVVTLGFIVSFVPHLLLMLIRQIKGDFADKLSDTDKAVYKFFLRSYFLNCAINPVIYSILDSRFKSACKDMLKHFKRRPDVKSHDNIARCTLQVLEKQ